MSSVDVVQSIRRRQSGSPVPCIGSIGQNPLGVWESARSAQRTVSGGGWSGRHGVGLWLRFEIWTVRGTLEEEVGLTAQVSLEYR